MKDVLGRLQRHWGLLAQIAAWLAGLVGAFLIEPPLVWPRAEDPGLWLKLSQFLIAIMVGLFFVNSRKSARQPDRWRTIAIAAVSAGVTLFILYQILRLFGTCVYRGETVMVGASLSQFGQDFMATHAGAHCDRLIGAALGYSTDVWPRWELVAGYIALCLVYSLSMLLFSAAAMATIEYVRQPKRGGASRRGRST